MGNEEIRINGIGSNNAVTRENLEQSYDVVRGRVNDVSIWDNFSPLSLLLGAAYPLVFNSGEIKPVALDKTLTGKASQANKYRMIRANEVSAFTDRIKTKNPFLEADIKSLQNEFKMVQNAGRVSKAQLATLNKKYFELLNKSTTWKSPVIKVLAKAGTKSPTVLGELTKAYKNNRIAILFLELMQEGLVVWQAFQQDTGTGVRQLVKSTGKVATGCAGYVAGMAAGAKIGALIGSIIPGAGTFVGGAIGSALGFAIGGFTSSLLKTGYDKLIPSEDNIVKDKRITSMLSPSDKTPEAKAALEQEIVLYNNYLKEAGQVLSAAIQSNDKETEAAVRAQMTPVNDVLNQLVAIYEQKFGINLAQATTETAAAQTPATQTSTGTTQTTTNTTYNNPATMTMQPSPLVNPYNPTGFVGNEFMNYTPQRDWSAMLPSNVANNLFMTA